MWDTDSFRQLALFPDVDWLLGAIFSFDGTRILTFTKKEIILYDGRLGKELTRIVYPSSDVSTASLSSNGRLIAIVPKTSAHQVHLLDTRDGKLIGRVVGHDDRITMVSFSLNRDLLLTSSYDKTARIWDISTGHEATRFVGHQQPLRSAKFDTETKRVITSAFDEKMVRVWDAETGLELAAFESEQSYVPTQFGISQDGTQALTVIGNIARVTNVATRKELLRLVDPRGIKFATFSPNGENIVTAAFGARVWSASTGKQIAHLQVALEREGRELTALAISPDGRRIAAAYFDQTVRLWRLPNQESVCCPAKHRVRAITQDGSNILETSEVDSIVRIKQTRSGKVVSELKSSPGKVSVAEFSNSGHRVLTVAGDRSITQVWDTASGILLGQFNPQSKKISAAAFPPATFTPDGERLIATYVDNASRVFDVSTGVEKYSMLGPVLGFSHDSLRVLTLDENNVVQIRDANTGKELVRLDGHQDDVIAASFDPSGSRVSTSSADRTVRIWDAVKGYEIVRFEVEWPIRTLIFRKDGKQILTLPVRREWNRNFPRAWDSETGRAMFYLNHNNALEAVLSPDGKRVVTFSHSEAAMVWDLASGGRVAEFKGDGWIDKIAFRSDGQSMVAVANGTVSQWETSPNTHHLVHRAKYVVPRCLTRWERELAFLDPAPPYWCITGAGLEGERDASKWRPKWPYHKPVWRDWLIAKHLGQDPSMPKPE